MKNRLLIFVFLALAPVCAKSQASSLWLVNYLPAISLGETADYTSNFSPRGVDFEMNHFFSEDLSVGFVISWVTFREKVTDELLLIDNATVSGIQYRYLNSVPININLKKYFPQDKLLPYMGVGLGTSYSRSQTDVGIFSLTDDQWQFNLAPEIGVLIPLQATRSASFKIKYNYSPEAGGFTSVSYISFGIGFGM